MSVRLPDDVSAVVKALRAELEALQYDYSGLDMAVSTARDLLERRIAAASAFRDDPMVLRAEVRAAVSQFLESWRSAYESKASSAISAATIAHRRLLGEVPLVDHRAALVASADSFRVYSSRYARSVLRQADSRIASSRISGATAMQTGAELLGERGLFSDEWKARRIDATEANSAYNKTSFDSAKKTDRKMRWTEHVDDVTFMPLDNKVGKDSIWLHGQVRAPGEAFDDFVIGGAPKRPPNRPHDRAILVPVRDSWVRKGRSA